VFVIDWWQRWDFKKNQHTGKAIEIIQLALVVDEKILGQILW